MKNELHNMFVHKVLTYVGFSLGLTFKEVNSIFFSGPHMHISIHSVHGNSTPANLQCNWISIARSVISVLIQPVPAVSQEIGVKADDHLPIGCLLLSNPIKCCVELTFTSSWVQTKAYRKQIGFVSICKYVNQECQTQLL